MLVLNTNPGGYQKGSGVRYFLGDFDGIKFTCDDKKRTEFIDYGSDMYAVASFFDYDNNP